jgi:hypothetical protein
MKENAMEPTKIVYYDESNQKRSLVFTCPRCRGHTLAEENTGATVRLQVSDIKISIDDSSDEPEAALDYTADCELIDLSDDSPAYLCGDCNFVLESEGGSPLEDRRELAEWLIKNCPQEDSAAPEAHGTRE